MSKYFDFESKIGWPEIIAISGALTATVISLLSLLEGRATRLDAKRARIEARARVTVNESTTAVDSRQIKPDGSGRFVWYARYELINNGEQPVSLRGAWKKPPFPIVLPMRDGAMIDKKIPVSIYAGETLQWKDVENDSEYFTKNEPTSWESLASLNLTIPGGQSKSIAFIYFIDNADIPTDGYLINLRFLFSNGDEHPIGHFLRLADPKGMAKDAG